MKIIERLKKIPTPYRVGDPRSEWVTVRLTPTEKAALNNMADAVGLKSTNLLYRLLREVIDEHESDNAEIKAAQRRECTNNASMSGL
jgi:hypothetical protein